MHCENGIADRLQYDWDGDLGDLRRGEEISEKQDYVYRRHLPATFGNEKKLLNGGFAMPLFENEAKETHCVRQHFDQDGSCIVEEYQDLDCIGLNSEKYPRFIVNMTISLMLQTQQGTMPIQEKRQLILSAKTVPDAFAEAKSKAKDFADEEGKKLEDQVESNIRKQSLLMPRNVEEEMKRFGNRFNGKNR
jgi:hypothetical protein